MFQAVDLQNLANFGHPECHQFELQNLCWFWNLGKSLVAWSTCQRPTMAHGHMSQPAPTHTRVETPLWLSHHPPPRIGAVGRPPATSAPRATHAATTSTCMPCPCPLIAATPRPSSPSLPLPSPPCEDSHRALCLAVPPREVPKQPPQTPVLLKQARPQTTHKAADAELHLPPWAAHHRRQPSDPLRSSHRILEVPRATSSLSGQKSCTDDPSFAPPSTSSPPPSTSPLHPRASPSHIIPLRPEELHDDPSSAPLSTPSLPLSSLPPLARSGEHLVVLHPLSGSHQLSLLLAALPSTTDRRPARFCRQVTGVNGERHSPISALGQKAHVGEAVMAGAHSSTAISLFLSKLIQNSIQFSLNFWKL
jgi:hypothetical protein